MQRVLTDFLLLCSLSALFFSFTYLDSSDDFTRSDLAGVLSLIVILSTLVALALWPIKLRSLRGLAFALACLLSAYSLHVMFIESLKQFSSSLLLLLALAAAVSLSVIHGYIDSGGLHRALKAFAIVLGTAAVLAVYPELKAPPEPLPEEELAPKAKFSSRPNVYAISYDSIVPRVLFRKFFEREEAPYHSVLDEEFVRYKNMFSDGRVTITSLNGFLAFTPDYFRALGEDKKALVTGRQPSPLLRLFEENGYQTTTFLYRDAWGPAGPFVTYLPSMNPTAACDFFSHGEKRLALLGYCRYLEPAFAERIILDEPGAQDSAYRHVERAIARKRPQMVFGHIYEPGHTPASYDARSAHTTGDFEAFREFYIHRGLNAERSIRRLVGLLQAKDPTAVLFVFGDHGAKLSRGLTFESDPEFFFQDNYGVYGGFLGSGGCSGLPNSTGRRFTTLQQVGHDIIACLFAGESASGDLRRGAPIDLEAAYENFLYE